MVYGSVSEVRKLSGIGASTAFSDPQILGYIVNADNEVNIYTLRGSTGWATTDFQYPTVVEASNHFAASRIIRTYPERMVPADQMYALAKEMCTKIVEMSRGDIDVGYVVRVGTYKTWPMNSEGEIHLSSKQGRLINKPSETDLYIIE
jgi:hypothetical protein